MVLAANNKIKKPNKYLRRNLFIFALLAVPLLHFLVFWVYINAQSISLAFFRFDLVKQAYEFVGLDNFRDHFRDLKLVTANRNMYYNSFRAIPINLGCLVMAILVGYAFNKHIPGERVFRVIYYLPSMISVVILMLCYRYMFAYEPGQLIGPAATALRAIGVNYPGWAVNDPEATRTVWALIYIFCIWASAGVNIILMASAMARVPEEVIESAKLDGVGFWRELFQIQLPLIMPTVSIFLINSVMAVAGFWMHPMMLAGSIGVDNSYYTVGWFMFERAQDAQSTDYAGISTIGLVLTVILTVMVLIVKKITDKLTPEVDF